MRLGALVAVIALGCGGESSADVATLNVAPRLAVVPLVKSSVCATRGSLGADGEQMRITEPTFRAVAPGSSGDAASLRFVYRGAAEDTRRLASGQLRRQVGLKLRAENGCNLVYVMWRIEPTPGLEVSVKRNPGRRTNQECGTEGYTKIKPRRSAPVPALEPGQTHTLRAEILGDELVAWVDGQAVWRGRLGRVARRLSGPAGMRSDNVAFDVEELSAPAAKRTGAGEARVPACPKDGD